ncbi:hypothetical protein M3C58_11995 [Brachybacterium muris]|uniref:Uncharacterized protein n=4 Tax=Brachybacterium TaxID=43668 RepID=A0A022KWG0_9MICO|nr:hypothetical protein [Brachybacterium muris]EYT48550.1 hypothetical protein D641_0111645 [Brachybacterium muris UCD-AY4]MCT1655391.1 hypothetical protein [Brachybacterium muris]MCT1998907.1 hypothetical protein [Brachybacterium muris]
MMIGGATNPVGRAEQEIKSLFAGDDVIAGAVDWARGVLMERGIDPSAHPVRALRALRKADRRLSLGSARYLADAAAGRPQRRGHTRSPFLE